MSAQIPSSLNFLSGLGFKFNIKKLPNTNFFVTKLNLPGITTGVAKVGTPFATLNLAADKTEFDDLQVTFKVDEDLSNWQEIWNWMIGISFPYSSDQRAAYVAASPLGSALASDGTITMMTGKFNPSQTFFFQDLQPIAMSGIEFDLQNTDIDYVTCTVTFKYTLFDIRTV